MPLFSKLISLLLLLLVVPLAADAQPAYPDTIGQRVRYEVGIDMPKAGVSGILIMVRKTDSQVEASLVNEFGVSIMDFGYDEKKEKVKLYNVFKKLDKWYIKRVLKSDLKQVLSVMQQGGNEYFDKKHKIKYTFTLINDTAE